MTCSERIRKVNFLNKNENLNMFYKTKCLHNRPDGDILYNRHYRYFNS